MLSFKPAFSFSSFTFIRSLYAGARAAGRGGGGGGQSGQLPPSCGAQEPLQARPEGVSCVSWIGSGEGVGFTRVSARLGRGYSQPGTLPPKPTPWRKCLGAGSLQPPACPSPAYPPRGWWSQAASVSLQTLTDSLCTSVLSPTAKTHPQMMRCIHQKSGGGLKLTETLFSSPV